MPAFSSKQSVAVRQNRLNNQTKNDPMGGNNYNDRGGYRDGASVNTTTRNPNNSMYNAMSVVWGKEYEQKIIDEAPVATKTRKVTSPRPTTPNGKGKNFIERNKQYVQAVPASTTRTSVKKPKEDSQSVSPTPSSKPKSSSTTQNRPVTPGATARTQAKTEKKTKVASSNRSVSPPASSSHQSAHSRSHTHVASPPSPTSGHGHSAHSRSHVRSSTPEASLRDEIKRLKKRVIQYEDWLNEKELEASESSDLVEALEERISQCEARNRELKNENEFMRDQLKDLLEKQNTKEPTEILSSVLTNVQRIRGGSSPIVVPKQDSPVSPTVSSKSSSPVPSSPKSSPKSSPALTTSKSKELSKANNIINTKVPNSPPILPRIVPKTRGNLILENKDKKNVKTITNEVHPPRPMAPPPVAAQSQFNNGGFKRPEIRPVMSASDRKQAAALNVVMEESGDSEVEEFVFDRDDHDEVSSDDQTDSSGESETENFTTENESHDEESDFSRWSTRASSRNDLGSIIEEEDDEDDEDDEDTEFEDEPKQDNRQNQQQQNNNLTTVNPVEPLKNSFATVAQVASAGTVSPQNVIDKLTETHYGNNPSPARFRRRNLDSTGSSDSGFGSDHEQNFNSNMLNSKMDKNAKIVNNGQSVYSSSKQTLDSEYPLMSSMTTKSDSSDDSAISVSSSKNNSYQSSTSPSSADISPCGSFISQQQNLIQSNGLNISQVSSKLMSQSNGKTGLNDKYSTSVSTSQSDNLVFGQDSSTHRQQSNNKSFNSVNNLVNSKRSPSPKNGSKQSNSRSNSPSVRTPSPASSSRASTPSSNASTARAPSPASPSSSRASTPASESSRNASGLNRRSRLNENSTSGNSSSDKCPTANPLPPSPPPPPATKDPFATLQHYLRLISENSVMDNPLKSYDIKKVIDEGSSAKVYNANPLSNPGEECAIKIVPLTYSLEFIFNELYVLKNFKHKNIVDFKESFLRWDGKTREVWIAMEKCARGDVTSRAGKVNQREVGRMAGELLSALKHLHRHGIIHRDIKLSNILVGANNEIKLADFGISSLTPTSTTSMVGTIPYMAPDVVLVGNDQPYDTKADIWSLGVCILELLTGKAAWGRVRDDEIMDKLRRGEMPHGFQRLRRKADIGWEAIDFLEKCFIKTPDNRWSAEKLLEHPFITGSC